MEQESRKNGAGKQEEWSRKPRRMEQESSEKGARKEKEVLNQEVNMWNSE